MSSRSEKDRYLPDTGASSIGGIPPACRNHRDPTGLDTPHATAASSLVSPRAICTQNARSRSRRTGGRPGDSITARPVNAAAQPGGRPIESTSIVEVLRPPVEPGQYTAIHYGETLMLEGLRPSVGTVGDAGQRAGRDHRRIVQERTHPPAGPLARRQPGRTSDRPMGRVVQHRTPPRVPRRLHPRASPTEPTEGSTPSSMSRWVNATEVY